MSQFITVLSAPVIGIFGGAGPPVFRAMMSKIVSADDQGSLFSAVSSVEMLCTFGGTALFNSLYPKSLKFDVPGFVFVLGAILMILPFFCTFCLKDQAMFTRKRLIVNAASGYEKINSDEENEDEQYAEDSPDDVSVDSPIISANSQETVKYV